MRILFAVLAAMMLTTPAHAGCMMDDSGKFPGCPEDAAEFLGRVFICEHFLGEHTGGISPQRDTEVNDALTRYHCGDADYNKKELLILVNKYRANYEVYYAMLASLNQLNSEFILNLLEDSESKKK